MDRHTDRRYQAYLQLLTRHTPPEVTSAASALTTQLLDEGKHSEFWLHVKQEIDQQIRAAEGRFLDTLAKDYETYVAWWNRRQALIAVLAIPETVKKGDS